MKKTVVVGLSGGVDSSVSALLLKEQGYNVIGLFMRNWDSSLNNDIKGHVLPQSKICSQELDYNDAKKVANKLKIKLYRVDFIKEYWDNVFTKFINDYKASKTPNPDILCNKYIKFNYFLKYALKELKADFVATGHYADVKIKKDQAYLLKCKDQNKDQTYFLAGLDQGQLKKAIFPLANLTKNQVKQKAQEAGLITANKKESMGICFIGKRKIKDFLQNYIDKKPGDIVDKISGNVLGKHDGTMFYSIGQRFGLNVGGLKEPIFVCGKDIKNNILFTAPLSKQEYFLFSNNCIIEDVHWINQKLVLGKLRLKFMHGKNEYDALVKESKNNTLHLYYNSKRAVTPGQACVLYKGKTCLGMGIVKEVFKDETKLY